MKKRLFFLFCFAASTYTMNKSLTKLEESPLSKEIIQNYLLQFQKEPPSNEPDIFANMLQAYIGNSKQERTTIVFKTSYIYEKNNLTSSTKCALFNKIMKIVEQKPTHDSQNITIDDYTKAQKPKPLGDNKQWCIECTTQITYHELTAFIQTRNRQKLP